MILNMFDRPVQAQSAPVVALPPLPHGVPPTDAEQRLAAALLAVVLHASPRFKRYTTGKICKAVPVDMLDRASDLLAELGY